MRDPNDVRDDPNIYRVNPNDFYIDPNIVRVDPKDDVDVRFWAKDVRD